VRERKEGGGEKGGELLVLVPRLRQGRKGGGRAYNPLYSQALAWEEKRTFSQNLALDWHNGHFALEIQDLRPREKEKKRGESALYEDFELTQ